MHLCAKLDLPGFSVQMVYKNNAEDFLAQSKVVSL